MPNPVTRLWATVDTWVDRPDRAQRPEGFRKNPIASTPTTAVREVSSKYEVWQDPRAIRYQPVADSKLVDLRCLLRRSRSGNLSMSTTCAWAAKIRLPPPHRESDRVTHTLS
jgi:hypothetical protein